MSGDDEPGYYPCHKTTHVRRPHKTTNNYDDYFFNLHDVVHEYVILTTLTSKIVLTYLYNSIHVLC